MTDKRLDVGIEVELNDDGSIKAVHGLDEALKGLVPASGEPGDLKAALGALGLTAIAKQAVEVASVLSDLTTDELKIIRDSLDYSVQQIRSFPHRDQNEKKTMLDPVLSVREKIRKLIAWGRL